MCQRRCSAAQFNPALIPGLRPGLIVSDVAPRLDYWPGSGCANTVKAKLLTNDKHVSAGTAIKTAQVPQGRHKSSFLAAHARHGDLVPSLRDFRTIGRDPALTCWAKLCRPSD